MKNERLEKLKGKLLKDPKFRRAYFGKNLASSIGEMIFSARLEHGWSQEKLANKIGTKQPGIARIERGIVIPTLPMLQKIADALGLDMELPKFTRHNKMAYFGKVTVEQILDQQVPGLDLQNSTEEMHLNNIA